MITRTYAFDNLRITRADDTVITSVEPKELRLTLDTTWAPYVQGNFELAAAATDAAVGAIEPRSDQRLRGTIRQTNQDGTQAAMSLDLALRSRRQSWRAGTLACEVASIDSLAQDYGFGQAQLPPHFGANASDIVKQYALAWYAGGIRVEAGAPDDFMSGDDTQSDPGSTSWEYASSLAEASGARLFCDENAVFHWCSPTWVADTTLYSTDDQTTVLDVEDTVSRDDPAWATMAVVVYTGNTPPSYVYDSAGVDPRKTLVVTRNRKKPSGNAATKIRVGAQKRGRTLRVTELADLRCRPSQRRRVSWGGITKTGVVQSVDFDIAGGLMTVQLNVTES